MRLVAAHNLKLMTSLLVGPHSMCSLIEDIEIPDWELLQSLRHVSVLVPAHKRHVLEIYLSAIRSHLSREIPGVTVQLAERSYDSDPARERTSSGSSSRERLEFRRAHLGVEVASQSKSLKPKVCAFDIVIRPAEERWNGTGAAVLHVKSGETGHLGQVYPKSRGSTIPMQELPKHTVHIMLTVQ